jgi:uncharacterized damage-inducible protein DinB
VTADHLRDLLAYSSWANRRVFDACARLAAADYFAKAAGLSFGSLHATLVHIVVAEVVWLARFRGELPPEQLKDARKADELATTRLPTFAKLVGLWRATDEGISEFAAALADADVDRPLSYLTQYGEPNTQPLGLLIAHLVNHGTQFRAEAAVRLTQLGRSPGDIDLIIYLREAT